MEKLEEKPTKIEEQEICRVPKGYSQAGQIQESNLDMGAVKAESKASKAYTGGPPYSGEVEAGSSQSLFEAFRTPKTAKLPWAPHSPTFQQEYPRRNPPTSQVSGT